jgi:hypothetical protein
MMSRPGESGDAHTPMASTEGARVTVARRRERVALRSVTFAKGASVVLGRYYDPSTGQFVVRLDRSSEVLRGGTPISEDDVVVTKAFWNEEDAETEADRLSRMNERFSGYFVRVARLVPSPDALDVAD